MGGSMTQEQIDEVFDKHTNTFPVPLGSIAEELGIQIISTEELDEDLSGSISKEGENYLIYVNAGHNPLRQRFTIAHELVHYKQHRDYLNDEHEIKNLSKKVLNRPTGGASLVVDETERRYEYEADQGAADILMPQIEFTRKFNQSGTIEEIVSHFGVSPAAINVRAYKLGLGYFE
jgi:Zn-dependent peptidase ImmA (M78 family)